MLTKIFYGQYELDNKCKLAIVNKTLLIYIRKIRQQYWDSGCNCSIQINIHELNRQGGGSLINK